VALIGWVRFPLFAYSLDLIFRLEKPVNTPPMSLKVFIFSFVSYIFLIAVIPASKFYAWRNAVYLGCGLLVLEVAWLLFSFVPGYLGYQDVFGIRFVENYVIYFGYDGFSLLLVLLTVFLLPFCLISAFTSLKSNLKLYILFFVLMTFFVTLSFFVLDLFFFYFFFESLLFPMFFLIGRWGSSVRRSLAAFYFFFFTLLPSLLMLLAIIWLVLNYGPISYWLLSPSLVAPQMQNYLFFLFFLPFAAKIPMFPFHIWLPEAHVEAPTSASMFLAAILLKLGAYGFVRFLLPLCFDSLLYWRPLLVVLILLSIYYCSFMAIRQLDIKRIVAYSSIVHMNFALLGLFSLTVAGFNGFFIVLLGHGIVSAALFFLVGVLYDRYKVRQVMYFTGLTLRMPLFSIMFFLFSLANTAFPLTVNFVGEFLILVGLFEQGWFVFSLAAFSLFFSLIFTFWLYNRLAGGVLSSRLIPFYYDLTRVEIGVLAVLFVIVILLGIFPSELLRLVQPVSLLLSA
jgi:proton-translocating NADH-quinone oxidoreductase chain M